ncbi:hypothetical protein LZ31DRAFT_549609 [Colletotrichum somersetense]|nr:hypothetical protein LZ31DRAFT_549609 [Colletotrichum somersetense]
MTVTLLSFLVVLSNHRQHGLALFVHSDCNLFCTYPTHSRQSALSVSLPPTRHHKASTRCDALLSVDFRHFQTTHRGTAILPAPWRNQPNLTGQ